MKHRTFRILLLEDSERDVQLFQEILEGAGLKFKLILARMREEFITAAAGDYDIALLDYSLPGYDGISAMRQIHAFHPDTPVIFVSGVIAEEEALEALRLGAADYVMKQNPKRLVKAVEQAIQKADERKARRVVEQRLYEAERLYSTIFENAPSPLVLLEHETGRIVEANRSFEKLFGFTKKEIENKTLLELGVVDQPSLLEVNRLIAWTKDAQGMDLIMRKKSGQPVHCALIISRLWAKGKEQVVIHVIDATAEDRLREAEHFYRTIFQTGPAGMAVTDYETGQIRDINDIGLQLLGFSRSEAVGKTIVELGVWDAKSREEAIAQLGEVGAFNIMEVPLHRKNGQMFLAMLSLALLDISGERRIIIHFTDLSAEVHLREMEKLYASVFTLGPGAIGITSAKDGRIINANQAALEMFGLERKDAIGKTTAEAGIWPKETRDRIVSALKEAGHQHIVNTTLRRASGVAFPARLTQGLISFGGENCFVTHIEDQTDEVKLHETEKLYSTTFLQSAEAIFITELSTRRIIDANSAGERLYGLKKEAMIGKTAAELGFIDEAAQDMLSRLLSEKGSFQGVEIMVADNSGKAIPVMVSQAQISKGDVPCVLTQLTDISRQRAVESVLRFTALRRWKSEGVAFFDALAQFLCELTEMDCCFIAELQPGRKHVKTLGMFADGQVLPSRTFSLLGTPCANVLGLDEAAIPIGSWGDCLQDYGGESYFGMPLYYSSGEPFGIIALMSRKPTNNPDLMETILKIASVRAELEYERNSYEADLLNIAYHQEALLEAIPDIVMEFDNNRVYTWANDAGVKFFGEDIIGKGANCYCIGEQQAGESILPVFSNGSEETLTAERWQRRIDGETRLLEWRFRSIKDAEGKAIGYISIAQDITERKANEVKLARHQEELENRVKERTSQLERNLSLLNATLESTADGIVVTDLNGKVIIFNERYQRMWGLPEEAFRQGAIEATIKLNSKLMANPAKYISRLNEIISEPEAVVDEEVRLKDGRVFSRYSVPQKLDGRIIGRVWSNRDITLNKQLEEELRNEADRDERLLSLYEKAHYLPDRELYDFAVEQAVCLSKSQIGFIHEVSEDQAFINFATWNKEALKNCQAVFESHYPIENAGIWAGCIRTGNPVVLNDYPNSTGRKGLPKGHKPLKRFMSIPVVEDGKIRLVFGVGNKEDEYNESDLVQLQLVANELNKIITQRHAEEQLRLAKQAAEEANRAKSAFLANMSHEIRTPLNAVFGYTQLLQRETSLDAKQRGYISAISRSGNCLLDLINDVLEMSRIEAGRVTVNNTCFYFGDLLSDIESMFRVRTSEKRLQFEVVALTPLPKFVCSDISKIRQVIINILGNAVKFTEKGGITVRVRCLDGAAANAGRICISIEVEDTGIGIAAEEIESIFNAFEQSKKGHAMGGTGLGMAISREFARLLGGDVAVESVLGKGSKFTFTFSAELSQGAPPPELPDDAAARITGFKSEGKPPPKVLVVDDEELNRQVMEALLSGVGFIVETAKDGTEAFAKFKKWKPDAILMDRRMPEKDGIEATKAIKATSAGKGIPIIMVTASALEDSRKEAMDAGANGFIRKPYKEADLFLELGRRLNLEYTFSPPPESPLREDSALNEELKRQVAALPSELVSSLLNTVEMGDILGLHRLIEESVAKNWPELAEHLHLLAQEYRYDTIQGALNGRDGAL